MNLRHIHQIAHLSTSVYRIAYTTVMLYWLFKRREPPPMVNPPDRYH